MLSMYKPATTWLDGVSHLVPACVFNLTSVNMLHSIGSVKLLHTYLTTVLCNVQVVDVSKICIGTLSNVCLYVCIVFTSLSVFCLACSCTCRCALLNINSVDSHTTCPCVYVHSPLLLYFYCTHSFTLSTSIILSICFIVVVAYGSCIVHHYVWCVCHTCPCACRVKCGPFRMASCY